MSAVTRLRRLRDRIEANRDLAWTAVRAYLGFALCAKSFVYLQRTDELAALMRSSEVPLASTTLAYVVALLHLSGGLLLAFGFQTRLAALVQIPNVLGAIVFVHWKSGLFAADQSLELAILVLVLLVLFALTGGGELSADESFRPRTSSSLPVGLSKPSTVER